MTIVLNRLVREEDGQDLIEYALLAAFISLVAFAAMQAVGTNVNAVFESVRDKLIGAVPK